MIIPSADDQIVVGVYASLPRIDSTTLAPAERDVIFSPAQPEHFMSSPFGSKVDAEVRFIRCALDGNGVQIDLLLRVRPGGPEPSSHRGERSSPPRTRMPLKIAQ